MPETPLFPDMTIYVLPDESGKLEPVAVSIAGVSLPVLRASFIADPNGRSTGSRGLVGEVSFLVGAAAIEEVESRADLPDLAVWTAEGRG